jgi:hypothetical protein
MENREGARTFFQDVQSRITWQKIVAQLKCNNSQMTMAYFQLILNEHVEAYLRYAFPISPQ